VAPMSTLFALHRRVVAANERPYISGGDLHCLSSRYQDTLDETTTPRHFCGAALAICRGWRGTRADRCELGRRSFAAPR
jgi:hypothetical protein